MRIVKQAAVALLAAVQVYGAVISASGILGQGGVYTTNTVNYPAGSINAAGLAGVTSIATDTVNHRMFVSDGVNKRILVFDLDSNNSISGTSATHVLGVCNFTSAGSGALSASTFGSGIHVFNIVYDSVNQRLFVADGGYNRVLMFLVTPGFSDCENATAVLGQPDFVSSGNSVLNGPDDMDIDTTNSRLFASSQNGNVVQAFSVPPGVSGGVPSPIFTLGTGVASTTQATLNNPVGQAYDPVNERLFVSDLLNNRVMVFPVPHTCGSGCTGENATFVLGQTNFTTGSAGAQGQATLAFPDDCTYDSTLNRFFVTDYNYSRIMVWTVPSNATSAFNGANATAEINNVSWTGGTIGSPPTQNSFTHPEAPHSFDPAHNRFFIYEYIQASPTNGNRVLQLNFILITTGSLPNVVVGTPYSQSIAISQNQGASQAYTVASGSLPNGLSVNSSTGAITGTPSVPGAFTFTIQAADNFSDGSLFFDQHAYSVTVSAPAASAMMGIF